MAGLNLKINKIDHIQIEKELTCKFCLKYFELPIRLDCGNFICRNDLEKRLIDVEGNKNLQKFLCFICKQFHFYDMKISPCFSIDKEKCKLLQEFLNKEERILAKNLINEIDEISKFEFNESDKINYIKDYFDNLRNEILLQCSLLNIRAKYLCDSLMKSIQDYENKCKSDNSNSFNKIIFNSDQWYQELREPGITDSRINEIILKLKGIKNDVNINIKKFEDLLLSKGCVFVSFNFDLLGDNFLGQLKPITSKTVSESVSSLILTEKIENFSTSSIPDDLASLNLEDLFKADTYNNQNQQPKEQSNFSDLTSESETKIIKIEEYKTINIHSSPVHTIKHISGDLYASGSQNNEIKVWHLSNPFNFFVPNDSSQSHKDSVECLTVSNDKRTLISGSFDNDIKIWNLYDQNNNLSINFVATLEGHLDRVFYIF
jgi:WD40 repeat protein